METHRIDPNDPDTNPDNWPAFAEDVPIYPEAERQRGFSFPEERIIHGDWDTPSGVENVLNWYAEALQEAGWTGVLHRVDDEFLFAEIAGWKGNRYLELSISKQPFVEGVRFHISEQIDPNPGDTLRQSP